MTTTIQQLGQKAALVEKVGSTAIVRMIRKGLLSPELRDNARYVRVDVGDAKGKKLLHHFIRDNKWGSPAGRIEEGEDPAQAAVRELLERTGYEGAPEDLAPHGTEDGTHVYSVALEKLKRVAQPGERGGYSTKIKLAPSPADLEKGASSRLRKLIKLIRINHPNNRRQIWSLKLLGKSIGQVQSKTLPNGAIQVIQSSIAEPYWGMGLGKKMLGDLFRSLPSGQKFHPGTAITPQNVRLWESMLRRSGKAPWKITRGKNIEEHVNKFNAPPVGGTYLNEYYPSRDKIFTMTRSSKPARGTPMEVINPKTMDSYKGLANLHLEYPGNQMGR